MYPGFSTAKGALVHSILFPKPMNLKLHRDAIRFVAVLACFAFVGAIYIITIKVINKVSLILVVHLKKLSHCIETNENNIVVSIYMLF